MNNLTLTASQTEALHAICSFLNDEDTPLFVLNGAAGTGKTTLTRAVIERLEDEERPYVLMAPTGRAAHILSQRTERQASTIHRGIYIYPTEEATSAKHQEQRTDAAEQEEEECLHFLLNVNEGSRETVYIVDEASMIADNKQETEYLKFGSGRLLTDLLTYVGGRKLIFVGDEAQLPPVGMNFSPAFNAKYLLEQHGKRMKQYDLKEIVRQQAESTILKNATRIRQHLEAQEFQDFRVEEGRDVVSVENLLTPYFELAPTKPNAQAIIIAHSNRQVMDYNGCVREHYYGAEAQWLNAGEHLMIARNNYRYAEVLYNGSFVRVDEVMNGGSIEHRRVKVKRGKEIAEVDLQYGDVRISFRKGNEVVKMDVKLLVNVLNTTENTPTGRLLAQAQLVELKQRLPEGLRNLKRKGEHNKELLKEYKNRMAHDPYYNALYCKYGYAITCHKAQGGEWAEVFVDMGRYGGTANEDYFRWAYTALTRSSRRICCCHAPEFSKISRLKVEQIELTSHPKVSVYSEGGDFRSDRFARVKWLCREAQMDVAEDLTCNYEHRLTFTNGEGAVARFTLWYNAKGYNGKVRLLNGSDEAHVARCERLITDSLSPVDVPFVAPDRPFAEKLVAFVKEQLKELDIRLLNITQEQYMDVFHLQTDGVARMSFWYNKEGNYTYMKLQSSLGAEDTKLALLRERFA